MSEHGLTDEDKDAIREACRYGPGRSLADIAAENGVAPGEAVPVLLTPFGYVTRIGGKWEQVQQ